MPRREGGVEDDSSAPISFWPRSRPPPFPPQCFAFGEGQRPERESEKDLPPSSKRGSRREGAGCVPSGGVTRALLAVRGEVASPRNSDDGPSPGHSRSGPPEGTQPAPGSRRLDRAATP